jgi:hypothetical protein
MYYKSPLHQKSLILQRRQSQFNWSQIYERNITRTLTLSIYIVPYPHITHDHAHSTYCHTNEYYTVYIATNCWDSTQNFPSRRWSKSLKQTDWSLSRLLSLIDVQYNIYRRNREMGWGGVGVRCKLACQTHEQIGFAWVIWRRVAVLRRCIR